MRRAKRCQPGATVTGSALSGTGHTERTGALYGEAELASRCARQVDITRRLARQEALAESAFGSGVSACRTAPRMRAPYPRASDAARVWPTAGEVDRPGCDEAQADVGQSLVGVIT